MNLLYIFLFFGVIILILFIQNQKDIPSSVPTKDDNLKPFDKKDLVQSNVSLNLNREYYLKQLLMYFCWLEWGF